jgi:uncharacterized protein YbaR (Trm112 family)
MSRDRQTEAEIAEVWRRVNDILDTPKERELDKILARSHWAKSPTLKDQATGLDIEELTTAVSNVVMAQVINLSQQQGLTGAQIQRTLTHAIRGALLEASGVKSKAFNDNVVRADGICKWCFSKNVLTFRVAGKAYHPTQRKGYERAELHCLNCDREYPIEREIK